MGTKTTVGASMAAGVALMGIVMNVASPAIEQSEGVEYKAYRDQAGILTVCDGHTGSDVVIGKTYTPTECLGLTSKDSQTAAVGVLKVSPQLLYHPYVLASVISFSYNVGVGAYSKSSAARDFNAGNYIQGCNDLLKYDMVDGKIDQGLVNRRRREQTLCLSTLTSKGLINAPVS